MVQIKEIYKKQLNKMPSDIYDDKLKKLRQEYEKPVKGMFEFVDAQGGWFDFIYKFFPGEPIQQIRLIHGEICELPMGIVKHLNNTKKKIRRLNLELPSGSKNVPFTYETQSRVRFTPVDMF